MSNELNDWCASIQKSLIEPLVLNIEQAIKQTGIGQLAIAGGVSANSHLRYLIQKLGIKQNIQIYLPPLSYTMDNAAMIGAVGQFSLLNGVSDSIGSSADARLISDRWTVKESNTI